MPEIRTWNLKHAKVTFHFTCITEGKAKGNRRKTEGAMIADMFTEISRTLHGNDHGNVHGHVHGNVYGMVTLSVLPQ